MPSRPEYLPYVEQIPGLDTPQSMIDNPAGKGREQTPFRAAKPIPVEGGKKKNNNSKITNPFSMSLDELINMRKTTTRPPRIIHPEDVYNMAKCGVSLSNIAGILQIEQETFKKRKEWMVAFNEGRADCGYRIRAMILQHAEAGNLDAMKYIDRYTSGESTTQHVSLSLDERPLTDVPTEQLIDIAYNLPEDDSE